MGEMAGNTLPPQLYVGVSIFTQMISDLVGHHLVDGTCCYHLAALVVASTAPWCPRETIRVMVFEHSRRGPVFHLLPLYAAFFVSVVAVTLSVGTYKSAQFVQLESPIRISPYLKSIQFVGLRSWEFCALDQQAVDTFFIDQYSANDGEDIATEEIELRSHVLRTTDLQTNTTTYVSTTYHFTPNSMKTTTWKELPSYDDILVPADYPNNDDDSLLASFPEELFSCHLLNFDSRSITNDPLWLLARVFFMGGTMVGTIATILLSCLLLIRVKNIDDRRILNNSLDGRRSSGIELPHREDQLTFVEKEMLVLDTDTSGCRQIATCFLISYLLQCLTLMFLNGKVCVSQRCILASGARSLIASCILWVVSALLIILMIKMGRRNQTKIRHLRKEISRLKSLQKEARDDEDNVIMDLSLSRTDSETSDTTLNDVET